jgi:DNA primase
MVRYPSSIAERSAAMVLDLDSELGISPADKDALLGHYAVAGPLIERIVGAIPFVWSTLPAGVNGPTIFHGPLSPHTKPKAAVVDVPTTTGVHRYPALSANRIEGLVRYGAIETYSWSPTPADPTRVRFARILLETRSPHDWSLLENGLHAVEGALRDEGIRSLRVYDGGTGAAIWVPFGDSPIYDDVRTWLHAQCARAVLRNPKTVTLEPNSHGGPPVHLHVQTNAVGRFSVLPYSARAGPGYPIAIPIDVDALYNESDHAAYVNGNVRIDNFKQWTERHPDPFASQNAAFYAQRFGDRAGAPRQFATTFAVATTPRRESHGPIVSAAIAVLQDGLAHTAEEILEIAVKRGLLEPSMTKKYVYTSLIEYIARAKGNGRKPAVVQNADHAFRINEPPDDWPALREEPAKEPAPAIAALIARLNESAGGGSIAAATAFEEAVCDVFDALGFAATHLGGEKAPDGYADALLGPLSYRTMIECKSSDEGVNDPSVFEASKFKDAYDAQFCALVGRAFSGEIEVAKELQNHGVSAWTVDDLSTLLRLGSNPFEMRPLFAPGFASDALDDLLWERRHGRAKRVRLVADAIVRTGRTTQAAYHGDPTEAPRITEDVAMVLVDQDLAAQGSSATCSRSDVQAAMDYLTNPLVSLAVKTVADGSIVILLSE